MFGPHEVGYKTAVSEVDARHWSPQSQEYAPAEVLIGYLRAGWTLSHQIKIQTFCHSAQRPIRVFYFLVQRGDIEIELPVVHNPVVDRVISAYGLDLFSIQTPNECLVALTW